MGILNTPNQQPPGLSGVNPAWIYIETDDTVATVTTTGYLTNALNFGWHFDNQQLALVTTTDSGVIQCRISVSAGNIVSLSTISISGDSIISAGSDGVAGQFRWYSATPSRGYSRLTTSANSGNTVTTINTASFGQASTLTIPDVGASTADFIMSARSGGQTAASSTASATPGTIRALRGAMTGSNTTMTSGNLVGVRGEVNVVGASGGFLYGAQGKVIATGTLSGSSWTAGVFGQLDISAATINAGQTAAIWGDYGTSSGTLTSVTGMRGVAMTNTTAAVLNAQDYRYGNATYLMELAGAGGTLNYYANAGTSAGSAGDSTHCAAQKVFAVEINGVANYIPVFTQNT